MFYISVCKPGAAASGRVLTASTKLGSQLVSGRAQQLGLEAAVHESGGGERDYPPPTLDQLLRDSGFLDEGKHGC